MGMKQGRNDPCSCGSGKKFKHCCEGKVVPLPQAPSPAELNQLGTLFNTGRYAELESRAFFLVQQYPNTGLIWMGLSLALQMQGKDALLALQKTAQLLPGDANAHNNLANTLRELGQLDGAVASCRRALKIKPDLAEAHSNLGLALRDLGQSDAAVSSFRRAIEIKPDFAEAHSNLGLALKDLGQLDGALSSCRRALKIKPNFADAHNNLGITLKELGQLDDAAASFRRAAELNPDYAGVHINLGNILESLGQSDDALESYRQALEIAPDSAETHYNLGNVLKTLGRLNDALASYRLALKIKPDSAATHNNLGATLKDLGNLGAAVESYRRALELQPDYAVIHSNLGCVLQELGKLDDAATSYQHALEIDPGCLEAMLGVGQLCAINGEITKAEKIYLQALEVAPDNLDTRVLLANTIKTQTGDENLAALVAAEDAVQNNGFPVPYNKVISLHFALGKCFDDLGDYDRAFPHFIEGCKLKRATFEYDAAQTTQHFNDVIQVFDWATIERLRGGGNPSQVPIFVLGMPRSGTTLTEQIIASHPEVHGAGELNDILEIAQRNVAEIAGFPNNIFALDQPNLVKWADDYIAGLCQCVPNTQHITDKMPDNFLAIGLIYVMLPNAKIIHVNRNPVDTCLSCFTKLFGAQMKQTYDLAELGRYYADYARLMEHWRKILPPGAFLDVQYEDIVADQETQARRMIDFCGLEWNDACIDFYKHKRAVNTASVMQVRQPIYKSSVERWRHYEKYLNPLLEALGNLAPKRN
jgi:tetratricopeptide (TPR) repeat protein